MTAEPGIEHLLARYSLPSQAAASLASLLDSLEGEHAPTAVHERSRALDLHLADSLVALEVDGVRRARQIADLGAGAGFPGLALAVALPSAHVTLVESSRRKCAWIDCASAAAGLLNTTAVAVRAEAWPAGLDTQDLVIARALAALPVLVEYAAPLLRLGGQAVFWKGRRDAAEEADGAFAAEELGFEPATVVEVEPFEGAEHRHLHVVRKVAPTPARFPRRPGIAVKRPLRRPAR